MLEAGNTLEFAPGQPNRPAALPMAPLIDIVFLLICFYLLVAQLIRSQKDPAVELPAMAHARSQRELPAEVVVNVRADGAIVVNGRAVSLAGLPGLLRGELDRARRDGKPFRVVVRADRRQQFARLDEALRACKRAGLAKVVFRAREEQPK
jgi:biopolymer transport protein ExbD